jgi:hypothetical protein
MTRRARCAAAALVLAACGALVLQAGAPARAAARPAGDLPERLADTGLYHPDHPGEIDPRNRVFTPQYTLWTDALTKRRWVYLPRGAAIDAADEHDWQFPAGTKFWKEFSHKGRKVETRLLWKGADAGWRFASYAWNDEGTDAVLAPAEGVSGVVEVAPGKWHAIPSRNDCTACHGTTRIGPLAFNALQLSTDRDPLALHAEPLAPGMLTLRDLLAEQRIAPPPPAHRDDPRIATTSPETRAALGYLAVNCGSCHDGRGDIAVAAPTLRLADLLTDGDAVARGLIGQPTRWQIPGLPEGATTLLHPGAPERSALLRRMMSRSPSSQMPPLGTVLRDEQAVEALARWITQLRDDIKVSHVSQTRFTTENRR